MAVSKDIRFALTFLLVGLLPLSLGGYLMARKIELRKTAVVGEGVVVEFQEYRGRTSSGASRTTYYPVIRFKTSSGEFEFTSSSGGARSRYSIGERVKILYDPAQPEKWAELADAWSFWGGEIVASIVGVGLTTAGAWQLAAAIRARRRRAYLKQHGVPVQAQLVGVEENLSVSSGGKHPFKISSQWRNPRTGDVHVFKSENLWDDPTSHIPGNEVTVYIDPDNPRRYSVDLSFLPREGA